ncbi:hypothetical protein JCM6882_003072 [Rhodosporidiobolus microsporus]
MSSKTRPPPPFPPKRTRSISASSASPAPLSPAYRLAEQYNSLTDEMANFSINREERISTLRRAQTEAQRLAHLLLSLREDVASKPNDLSLRIRLLDVEGEWKRAFEREKQAKQALNSPSMAGPSAPRMPLLDNTLQPVSAFPPSPPRTPSPVLQHRRLSLSSSPPKPSLARPPSPRFSPLPHRSPSPRPLSHHHAHGHSRSPSLASAISASPRPSSPGSVLLPLPPQTPVPRSDPLPAIGHHIPSHSVLVTSHLTVPSYVVTQELGIVQAVAPSSTDLGGLKERLRVEGEKRGAHAVVGVATKDWGAQGGLVGVGRAVKLKRV